MIFDFNMGSGRIGGEMEGNDSNTITPCPVSIPITGELDSDGLPVLICKNHISGLLGEITSILKQTRK